MKFAKCVCRVRSVGHVFDDTSTGMFEIGDVICSAFNGNGVAGATRTVTRFHLTVYNI